MPGGGGNRFFSGMGTSGMWVGTRKGGLRVNMGNVFCIHI
jgi:hypothetical protein